MLEMCIRDSLCSKSSACSTTCLAYPRNSAPLVDRDIPLLERRNISIPISFSNSFTDFERLGCVMNSVLAASLMDPQFTISIMYFSCCSVIIFYLYFTFF